MKQETLNKPLSERAAMETNIGQTVADLLYLKFDKNGRTKTSWGTKSIIGLGASITRIVEEETPGLTKEEKGLLSDMLSVYQDHLNKMKSEAGDFIYLGMEAGELAASGDKYTENMKVWDIRDNIRKYLEEVKTKAGQLIIKLNS